MKASLTYIMTLGCIVTSFCFTTNAQSVRSPLTLKNDKITEQLKNFEDLRAQGFTKVEIYQDLGNAYFLSKNYETALFWYERLMEISDDGRLTSSYQRRYDYALSKIGKSSDTVAEEDENWTELVRSDYQMTSTSSDRTKYSYRDTFKPLNFNTNSEAVTLSRPDLYIEGNDSGALKNEFSYETPAVLTEDGKTAYFSKAVYVRPLTGIFSKKSLVHRVYKANRINGEWKTIQELPLCPNDYSALHPSVSKDGKQLFFASNMPGSFGKYDIYVSDLKSDGRVGIAKNLGSKVNTDENDVFPKMIEEGTLVFASEGHKGYGGLDVYMVEVNRRSVGLAVNLGSPINSVKDDFAIHLSDKACLGYVVSDRAGKVGTAQRVAFTYTGTQKSKIDKDYQLLEALNHSQQTNYSSSVFEDE